MAPDAAAAQEERDDAELKGIMATLTHSQRLGIVRALGIRPGMGSAELAAWMGLPAQTVRKQLRTLIELGMVEVREREERRGAGKLYFANRRRPWITAADEPILTPRERKSVDFEVVRAILDDVHRSIGAEGYGSRPGYMVASQAATVDERAWHEISELQHELLDRIVEIVGAGRERLAEGGGEPVTLSAASCSSSSPAPDRRQRRRAGARPRGRPCLPPKAEARQVLSVDGADDEPAGIDPDGEEGRRAQRAEGRPGGLPHDTAVEPGAPGPSRSARLRVRHGRRPWPPGSGVRGV